MEDLLLAVLVALAAAQCLNAFKLAVLLWNFVPASDRAHEIVKLNRFMAVVVFFCHLCIVYILLAGP